MATSTESYAEMKSVFKEALNELMQEQREMFRDIVREVLQEGGGAGDPDAVQSAPIQSKDDEVEKEVQNEIEAYHRLHPTLWEKYPDQHVAIYNQEMIDHDQDFTALYQRIDEAYPDKFVLLRQVEKEPEKELRMRSPRLVSAKS